MYCRPATITLGLATLLASAALLASCETSGAKPPSSKLEYLNGEKYDTKSPISVGGVPIPVAVERASESTSVRGTIYAGDGGDLYRRPIRFERVELVKDGEKVIAGTTSNADGTFVIQAKIPDGAYRLRVASPLYAGERDVIIKGYETDGVDVLVKKK